MDEIYKRQDNINHFNNRAYTIIGVGGVGAWVAIYLAMSGAKEITLVDADKLELSNLNRLPFSENDIGKHKVDVVKEFIVKIRPDTNIFTKTEFWTENSSITHTTIDTTDDSRIQEKIHNKCRKSGYQYIRGGYNGLYRLSVCNYFPKWGEASGQTHYGGITPSWVVPASIAGAMVVNLIERVTAFNGESTSYSMDLLDVFKK